MGMTGNAPNGADGVHNAEGGKRGSACRRSPAEPVASSPFSLLPCLLSHMPLTEPQPVAAAKAPAILRAQGLKKTFRMGDSTVTVLKRVDLSLHPGEFVAIEGRSGSGKSTLLHILGALDAPDAGSIEFDGQDLARLSGIGPQPGPQHAVRLRLPVLPPAAGTERPGEHAAGADDRELLVLVPAEEARAARAGRGCC